MHVQTMSVCMCVQLSAGRLTSVFHDIIDNFCCDPMWFLWRHSQRPLYTVTFNARCGCAAAHFFQSFSLPSSSLPVRPNAVAPEAIFSSSFGSWVWSFVCFIIMPEKYVEDVFKTQCVHGTMARDACKKSCQANCTSINIYHNTDKQWVRWLLAVIY